MTHPFKPHRKYYGFCAACGYLASEPLQHHQNTEQHTMSNTIDNSQDVLDVRDIIARVEDLEDQLDANEIEPEEIAELGALVAMLNDMKGNGGDEQWRGDWYPITLIRDSYFKDYAQELAEDCVMVNLKAATWPNNHIDWAAASRELRMDYTSTEFDGVTYWYR